MHPVEEIILVEIVPEVQELAAEWFDEFNLGVYRDPRTRLVVEDGRNHLRGTPEQYDAVVADLFVPNHSGVGAMYSREHFESVKQRLAPGGVFCQWLPIYQLRTEEFLIIAATFLEVFPDATLWRGDFFVHNPTAALVGIAGEPASVGEIDAAAKRLLERGAEDRWITDPGALWMFYLGPLEGVLDLANVPRNSDGWPVFEYFAARTTDPQRAVFRGQAWPNIWRRTADATSPDDPIFPGRPFARTLAGKAMAGAGLMVAAEGDRKIAEAISLLRANVPAELLEHPDKTVSEFWPTLAEKP
jgi:spermidine synthase